MAPTIDLYYYLPSPSCRAVMLTANVSGIKLNLKPIDILKGDHLDPTFVKINPQHIIPTINDNGLIAWESRAIMCYLIDVYATDESLYPKDPTKRLLVNQRLYFDMGTLYQRFYDYAVPVIFTGITPDQQKKNKLEEALEFLNIFLELQDWVAGNAMTIADISIVATISTVEAIGINISKYTNINSWYARIKKALHKYGFEEINQTGSNTFADIFRSKLS